MSLSIVTCVRNGAQFVDNYTNNIKELKKALNEKLELIIVDDGSTDSCIETLQINLPWARFFSNRGKSGLPAARNLGKQQVNNEKTLFLDIDDRVHLDGLRTLLSLIDEHNADMVFGNVSFVNENGQSVAGHKFRNFWVNRFVRKKVQQLLYKNTCVTLGAVLFNSSTLKQVSFDEILSIGEDWEFLVRLHISGIKILHEPTVILDYMVHEKSMSSTQPVHQINLLKSRLIDAYSSAPSRAEQKFYLKKMELSIFTSSLSRSDKSKTTASLLVSFWQNRHLVSASYVLYFLYFFIRRFLRR